MCILYLLFSRRRSSEILLVAWKRLFKITLVMLKNKLRKEEFKKLQRNQYDFLSLLLGVKICSTKFIKWIKEFIKELNNVTKSWENGFQKLFAPTQNLNFERHWWSKINPSIIISVLHLYIPGIIHEIGDLWVSDAVLHDPPYHIMGTDLITTLHKLLYYIII